MIRRAALTAAAVLALAPAVRAAPPPPAVSWITIAPQDLLVIETGRGRILIELRPDLAPRHVARVRELAREGWYDGSQFYRVVDRFMAQGGAKSVAGPFDSDKPNLKGEFTVAGVPATTDWLGASPLRRLSDGTTFARFCPGTASFAHYDDPDTANAQFFLMREAGDSLEKTFTVWGRVVAGLDIVRGLEPGQPPAAPVVITRVRVAADLAEAERPTVEIADTASPGFRAMVEVRRKAAEKAYRPFSLCDVEIAARVR
ncbi:MAG: peptidylprolyl isomerase [Caulobacteraceae bacterium]|nr:peptidylprolyl isomerase [Caulobacteraceae bacterium]